jgi:glycogen operon protein
MTPEHWNNRMSRILGARIGEPGRGDAPLLLMVNATDEDARFVLPPGRWVAELDTTRPDGRSTWRRSPDARDDRYELLARSLALLRDAGTDTSGGTAP